MNTITHALLPVIGTAMNRGGGYWNRKKIITVSIFGALPDLVSPHLGIEARYTSWSHGIPAFIGIALVLTVLCCFKRIGIEPKLALWMVGAYFLHLLCDMVSGGIAWLYPFHSDVIGDYYVSPLLWIPLDFILAFAVYMIFRAIPRYKLLKQRSEPVGMRRRSE